MRWLLESFEGPMGPMLLLHDGAALAAVEFADHAERLHALARKNLEDPSYREASTPSPFAHTLRRYFEGELSALDALAVHPMGTPFQARCWAALRTIPAGETRTYAQQAALIGAPKAVRAVGLANGRNPLGVVVPCHRVVGAGGTLTGYAGGLSRKAWLLRHEARWAASARGAAMGQLALTGV